MSDPEQPVQEPVKAENSHVALKISGQGFPDLMIKVKRTTKLSKMMSAYCDRAGKSLSEVRFLFDGVKLTPNQTVADLDIDDDDEEVMIEVTSEAVGGGGEAGVENNRGQFPRLN